MRVGLWGSAVEIEGAGKDTAASIWHPRTLSVLDQKNVDLSSTQRRESAPRECDPLRPPPPVPVASGLSAQALPKPLPRSLRSGLFSSTSLFPAA